MSEDAEWLEKMASIGHVGRTRGQARVRPLIDGGKVRGAEIDRHDGSVEAVVRPDTNAYTVSLRGNA